MASSSAMMGRPFRLPPRGTVPGRMAALGRSAGLIGAAGSVMM